MRPGRVGAAAGSALALTCLLAEGHRLAAESTSCKQASAMVAEARRLYESASPDHAALLQKLTTARNLCPTLGEAWILSACSAQARGDAANARIFRDRALLNGAESLTCPAATGAAPRRPATAPPGPVRAKYALIVGIGHFKDPTIHPLQFAAKDARDLYAVLTDPRYGRFEPANVKLLTDDLATRENILNALQELFVKAEEDDLVFLYISSHGSPHREEDGLGGVGYIVTYDTSRNRLWLDALDYQSFSRQASLLRARRKAIFLDTCYSGQARPGEKALTIEGSGVDTSTAKLFLSGEGSYVITSSRAGEQSYESETLRNSYFTYHLIAALKHDAEPPTLRQVYEELAREVPAGVAHDNGQAQHPQLVPADGPADLRIGVQPSHGTFGRRGGPGA
ncbi:MAG: caspase family protein [Acidobacteriota bacterium]|nr:caspase family protein [Acidobacteriota bacterium]